MDYIIVISSDPTDSFDYEQGLEVAMTLTDLEQPCAVCLEGEFLDKVANSRGDEVFVKKLKQLELFGIELFSPIKPNLSFCSVKTYSELFEIYKNVKVVISF